MAREWREVRIEEIAERVAMGPFGSSIRVETFVPDGVPVISGQHLHGFKVDDSVGYNFITPEHAERLKNANVQPGDIIFTHAGNIGQVAYIPDDSKYERYVISQRQFYMRCDRSKAIPEFVVAYFKTAEGQHKLLANTSQVGVPSIAQPVTYLRTIEIPLPPLPEQRAIAHILGTLDDKIELNRRMNETLEAMARAIFKSWFIDFDPVRAKAEGRWQRGQSLPGLPAHLYDLFPDRLVDSELGEIPEGWEIVTLQELIEANPSRSLRKGDMAPYLDMANMPTRGHVPAEVIERAYSSGTRFINGDTLVARITPCLENGKTAFVDFLGDGQVGWGSTEYIVLRPKPPLPEEFAYCLARSEPFREFAIQSMTGTSGRQRVQTDSLAHFKLPRVPTPVGEAFGRLIRPLFAQSSGAVHASRTLAGLRDALLPKLIRGEIRVKDAVRVIGRVV
jgi:type I restriction enzyme S subunit